MRVRVADCELAVDRCGDEGPDILLLHGLGGSRRSWTTLLPLLAGAARAWAVDLRGCGDSTRGDAAWTLAQAGDDILGLADALDLGRWIVVGHSLGGVIAQEIITRNRASVAGAVLVSTSSRVSERATANWQRVADAVEARGLGNSASAQARGYAEGFPEANPGIVDFHSRITASSNPLVYAAQARAASAYDYTDALAGVACPVLVLQGLADQLTPPGGSVLLHRALPPGNRLEMLEGAGHNLPFEMPERSAELILGFASEALG